MVAGQTADVTGGGGGGGSDPQQETVSVSHTHTHTLVLFHVNSEFKNDVCVTDENLNLSLIMLLTVDELQLAEHLRTLRSEFSCRMFDLC